MPVTTAPPRNVGLFFVRYGVSSGLIGAPMLTLALTVNSIDHTMSGVAHLTQPAHPAMDVRMHVQGSYIQRPIPVGPGIVAHLIGHPIHEPRIPLFLVRDLDLRMHLNSDFQSGVASYRYRAPNGRWIEVHDVPVHKE